MSTLFDLSDDQIVAEAARIMADRRDAAIKANQAETQRLFNCYAKHIQNTPESEEKPRGPFIFGSPKALTQEEALLIAALERNKYRICMHEGESHWWGDAVCEHGVQDGAICAANSRRDLLLSLWAGVSGQTEGDIKLTEEHLNGSVVQAHLRVLNAEVRKQDRHERARQWAWGIAQ